MVYVDAPIWRFGRMRMCHMVADSLEELHDMAGKLGLRREWFQQSGSLPHYDICLTKRKQAIKMGASEISRKDLVQKIRQHRNASRP